MAIYRNEIRCWTLGTRRQNKRRWTYVFVRLVLLSLLFGIPIRTGTSLRYDPFRLVPVLNVLAISVSQTVATLYKSTKNYSAGNLKLQFVNRNFILNVFHIFFSLIVDKYKKVCLLAVIQHYVTVIHLYI